MTDLCPISNKPEWEQLLFDLKQTTIELSNNFKKVVIDKGEEKITLDVPEHVQITNITKQKSQKYTTDIFANKLGEGGFGVVYKYWYGSQSFALKCSNSEEYDVRDPSGNLISLADVACDLLQIRKIEHTRTDNTTQYFYIMPALDQTLERFLRSKTPPKKTKELTQKITIATKVLEQVECIFQKTGLPYLDLKPENIMYRENKMCVQLVDLGSLVPVPGDEKCMLTTYFSPELDTCIQNKSSDVIYKMLSWPVGVFLLHIFAGEKFTRQFYLDGQQIRDFTPKKKKNILNN